MTSRDPMVRYLANQLSAMQDRIRAMEVASQAAFRSIEGGSIDVYDDETDELLGVIGQQKDGSIGVNIKTGKKPEAPTEPDVQPIPGGAIVAWDGRFEDRQSSLVIDRVAVHMDETPGFTPDRDTEVAAVRSTGAGGTAVIPIDDGAEWYVKLVAVSKGGVWSDPSAEVFVAAVDSERAHFQDEFVLTAAGAQDLTLTYEPVAFSEHLYWNGLYQREDVAWTRERKVVSITDTPFSAAAEDVITVEYAYEEAGQQVRVDWGSDGWSYKTITMSDSNDYSSPGYDDSSWPIGQAPFGYVPGSGVPGAGWLLVATPWSTQSAIWIRRQVDAPAGTGLTLTVRIDNVLDVYWNGTRLYHDTDPDLGFNGERTIAVASNLVGSSNLLAIRAADDTTNYGSGDGCYVDAQLEEA